ncbi:MAG: lytic transglycosylase [Deltaproteobacteria bacterium]|nr:MAG: lytic transglycosylase [Deltaproteobacteria bacterium]
MKISTGHLLKTGILITMAIGLLLSAVSPSHSSPEVLKKTGIETFPVYPSIEPNVAFWIDMFTRYTRSQGVIHDVRHLDRIYEVIRLDPSQTRTAAQKNKKKKEAVQKKYKRILLALAAGKPPATPKEKQVAALFGSKAGARDFKQAAHQLRCQTGLTLHFKEGLIRSGAVIKEFKQIFRSHGLPVDLAYLPCVESSFDFTAYSKFGAAGIWQFTRGTGRMYMKIGYVVDQRRDPYISTQAAARLLKRNYAKLGEWPLALTAYNHGVNGMLRAQKQKGGYENIFNTYQGRSFRFASRNFYSEFLAARQVAKNYKTYFGEIPFQKPVHVTRYTTRGYLPAKALAQGLNLDIQTIKELNPSLRSPVFSGRKHIPKGFELRLPKQVPHKTIARVTAPLYQAKQKPSKFHEVRKGDTAGGIARIHSVPLNELMMANGLNRRATIYIGQNLRIPVQGEVILPEKLALAKPKPTIQTKKTAKTPLAPETPTPPDIVLPLPHKKTPPPLLLPEKSLAKTEPTPQAEVAPPLPDGPEALAKPISEEPVVNLAIVTSDLKIKKTFTQSNQLVGVIRVAPEETLGHYADWLQIPTRKIRALNQFPYGKTISIDQKIKLPLTPKDLDRFEELRYEYHKEMEEDFFESFSIIGVDTYKIKDGDTIWLLCLNKLEIPLWLLKKYNPVMDFSKLKLQQTIKYPIVNSPRGFEIQ